MPKVQVDLEGANTGKGTLPDPFLGLFDSNCNLLALNDDNNGNFNSRLIFFIPPDGVFVLAATSFGDSSFTGAGAFSGSYQLTIAPATPHITFTPAVVSSASPSWAIQGSADFNGDGKSDILWRDTASGAVGIWIMDGPAMLGATVVANPGLGWQTEGVGDLDGDGRADIVFRETPSGAVAVWFMDGATLLHATVVGNAPLDWAIASVSDLDGDGLADLLWRHLRPPVMSGRGSLGVR